MRALPSSSGGDGAAMARGVTGATQARCRFPFAPKEAPARVSLRLHADSCPTPDGNPIVTMVMTPVHHAAALAAVSLLATPAFAQQVVKPPIARYAVDIGTRNMSIPGMPAGGMAGMMMPGGMGGGPTKELFLGLASTQKPAAPAADHDIPPGMNMGKALPLLPPPPAAGGRTGMPDDERPPEKPKARMLVYWGCGEAIRPGQPKIADTEKMSLQQFGEALRGRAPPDGSGALRHAQLRWPNEREPKPVPPEASLRGDQFVHGNATPDIRFTIGERQDFLAPFEVAARGEFPGPFALGWKSIPHAQGYLLQAIGHRESTGEMIIWSSSELQDTGWGLMTWLPNDFLRRMIADKVVLPPEATSCAIPAGIFEGVQGAMVQTIAYGEELNLVHPPRPADPKVAWEQVWTAKLRVKSTGMVPLGMGDMDESSRRGARTPAAAGGQPPSAPPRESKPPSPVDDAVDAMKGLKGIFKF